MEKISIIGSGNVGANAAFFIAEKGITHVFLYDIKEGISTGKALDMMEASPIRKYRNKIKGVEKIEEIGDSQTVVIAANQNIKAGMNREELLEGNIEVINEIGGKIKKITPESIVIIATEPVDILTAYFVKKFNYKREKVFGVGGILDSTRLKYFISKKLSISLENVTSLVIGPHNHSMIINPLFCRVSGIPLSQLLEEKEIEKITEEVKTAGKFIVEMAQKSRTYYSPSAAVAELADSIHMDLRRILPVSVLLSGEYGLNETAMSLPCVIGKNGIEKIILPKLSRSELTQLKNAADENKEILKRIKT